MTELRQRHPPQKDRQHLAFVRAQPCCVCGSTRNVEAAHLKMRLPEVGKEMPGMQEKADDRYTTPLCHYHHQSGIQAQHKVGEEVFWREIHGRNPFEIADRLWIESGGAERAATPNPARKSRPIKVRKPRGQRSKIAKAKRTIAGRKMDGTPVPSVSKTSDRSTSGLDEYCETSGVASSRGVVCEREGSDSAPVFPAAALTGQPRSPAQKPPIHTQLTRHSTCSSSLPSPDHGGPRLTAACGKRLPERDFEADGRRSAT